MNQLLDLLPLGLFFILFWKSHPVSFNEEYLSLSTSKYLKGWFCLVIVLHHLSQWTSGGVLFRPFTQVGYLAVAVFFFFSAFGTTKKYMLDPNYSHHFLLRRLPLLFLPYLVASVCYVLIQSYYGAEISMWQIFWPWEKGNPTLPHSWYIFSVSLFYVCFRGIMKLCKRRGANMLAGMCIYYFIYTCFCLKMEYGPWWTISSSALIVGLIGAWKEKEIASFLREHKSHHTVILLLGIQGVLWGDYVKGFFSYNFISYSVISCLMVIALCCFSARWRLGNAILSFLGNIYLEIYLVHGIFIWIVPMRRPDTIITNEFVWCCVVLAGSIGGGYLLHQLCKKPLQVYQNWLKQH